MQDANEISFYLAEVSIEDVIEAAFTRIHNSCSHIGDEKKAKRIG